MLITILSQDGFVKFFQVTEVESTLRNTIVKCVDMAATLILLTLKF